MDEKEKIVLQQIKQHIDNGNYHVARFLLSKLNSAVASDWLVKVNKVIEQSGRPSVSSQVFIFGTHALDETIRHVSAFLADGWSIAFFGSSPFYVPYRGNVWTDPRLVDNKIVTGETLLKNSRAEIAE